MKIRLSAITDAGKQRDINEDAYTVCQNLSLQNWNQAETGYKPLNGFGAIAIVADGMGGENAGEVASAIAIDSIKNCFTKDAIHKCINAQDYFELIKDGIRKADEDIKNNVKDHPDTEGMGTTIVVCLIIGNIAYIAWCGDSRCYVYNPLHGLKMLTKDHSYVQELIDRGEITEEEAFQHPDNSVITECLGDLNQQPLPDTVTYTFSPNDTFLLCSDGLCGYCRNKEIEKIMDKYYTDANRCCDKLLKLALDKGGHDNICIVLASLINNDQESPQAQSFFNRIKAWIPF